MKRKLLLIPMMLVLLMSLALGAHAQGLVPGFDADYPFLTKEENAKLKATYAKIDAILDVLDRSDVAEGDPRLKEVEKLYESIFDIEKKIEEYMSQDHDDAQNLDDTAWLDEDFDDTTIPEEEADDSTWSEEQGETDEYAYEDPDQDYIDEQTQTLSTCAACGAELGYADDQAYYFEDDAFGADDENADDFVMDDETQEEEADDSTWSDEADDTEEAPVMEEDSALSDEEYLASLTFLSEEERNQLGKAYQELDRLVAALIELDADAEGNAAKIKTINQKIDQIVESIQPIEQKIIASFSAA